MIQPWPGDPAIEVIEGVPELSAALVERVDAIWRRECEERSPRDGSIFSLVDDRGARWTGRFVPYRHFVAQLREPALFERLRVRPLAVCGVTILDEGVLVGRRAPHVTQDPGAWDVVPSGGVHPDARGADGRISLRRQLVAELEEELARPESEIIRARPLARIEDVESRVVDVLWELELDTTLAQIAAGLPNGSREYVELRCVPSEGLPLFLETERARLGAVTPAALRFWLGSR